MTSMELLKAMEFLEDDIILETEEQPKVKKNRLISRPMLIAAVLLAGILLITACTVMGGAEWFLRYFSNVSPGILSAAQVEYIVANTMDVHKSQTVNGYTLTLKSVFSDGRDILIQFELTGPRGTVLDADSYSDMHGIYLETDTMPQAMAMEWTMRDEDRTDNRVELLYSIASAWNETVPFAEASCRLYIYGLEAKWREYMDVRSEPLTEGCWSFDIHFPAECSRSISFVQEPVPVTQSVTVDYQQIGENALMPVVEQQEGQITALNLWALGAELSFRFGEESRNAEFGDLYAVMKNGEKILLKQYFGAPDFITYQVETPILLDQVEYLELEDGTRFPAT